MINIINKEDCCGCEACVQICPKTCISLSLDTEGFYYPVVDTSVCVDCGLCDKTCPVINQPKQSTYDVKAYAVINKDKEVLDSSSSGGAFTALANEVIKNKGIVFGAVFDEDFSVFHTWTDNLAGVKLMRGSKYVQSRIGDTFKETKLFLQQGRQVLFSGTPCQILALNLFLRKEYTNLITIDFICHGVPSPGMWQKYLSQNISYNPKSVIFRDKSVGWEKYQLRIEGSNGENYCSIHSREDNYYMRAFLKDIINRPSCSACPVKEYKSGSSIKLADFWGVKLRYPELWSVKGVSLCLTKKSDNITNLSDINCTAVDFNKSIIGNPAYYNSTVNHPKRKCFFSMISSGVSFNEAISEVDKKRRIQRIMSFFVKVYWKIKFSLGFI